MRHLPALLLAAASAAAMVPAGPAGAEGAASDAAVIEACLKREPDRLGCIGRVSEPCEAEPGGDTTIGMADCLQRETAAWDLLLNRHYKELRATEPEPARTTLRDAQRAWIAWRDKDCAFAYEQYLGGTLRVITGAACHRDRTAERVIHLLNYLPQGR